MADNHSLINSLSPSPLEMRQHQSAFTAAATENSSGCGEIVEVQGGHIIRSIGKKDRHSKVCTAKGPRDRRVRLSAPTAIQFYNVQDRLGFDRPSKVVDWLIKKAKSAIDDLAELPPWNPVDTLRQHTANAKPRKTKTLTSPPPPPPPPPSQSEHEVVNLPFSVGFEETEHHQDNESSFLPASMDSDSIADTIKSFFPVASTQEPPSQTNTQNQDLRLSLQSFQNGPPFTNQTESVLFSGQINTPLVFESSWDQNHQQSPEFGKIQRLVTWNNGGGAADSTGTGGGFVFASSSPSSFQPVYSQSQLFSQRGPLQSINTPLFCAWCDPYHPHHHHQSITSNDLHNHHHHHHPYHVHPSIHQSAIPGIAGFRVPAWFHGEQEDHGGNNKPSSASRH